MLVLEVGKKGERWTGLGGYCTGDFYLVGTAMLDCHWQRDGAEEVNFYLSFLPFSLPATCE
jgi:hypothetical protein